MMTGEDPGGLPPAVARRELAGRCVHLFPLGLHCNEAAQPGEFGGAQSGPVATPLEMAAELAGLAEHVTADHEALARVWALAGQWERLAKAWRRRDSRWLQDAHNATVLDMQVARLRDAVTGDA